MEYQTGSNETSRAQIGKAKTWQESDFHMCNNEVQLHIVLIHLINLLSFECLLMNQTIIKLDLPGICF